MKTQRRAGSSLADPAEHGEIIAATRRWVQRVVIDLNLCPFARRRFDANRIRFAVTGADNPTALLESLHSEILYLKSAGDDVATTLLIHPRVLSEFDDYNQFLDSADELLELTDSVGVLQIASFHPRYRFASTQVDDAENYSNRSPYPMLHLLREADVEQEIARYADIDAIPGRNIERLRALGADRLQGLLASCATPVSAD